jgi:hypothetical protein
MASTESERVPPAFLWKEVNVPGKDHRIRATLSLCVHDHFSSFYHHFSVHYSPHAPIHTPPFPPSPPLLIHPPLQPCACHPLLRNQISHQTIPTGTITLEPRPETAAGKFYQSLAFQIGAVQRLWVGKGGEGRAGGGE